MVSTDDEKIADVARSLGAEVPFMRSEKTFNDFATTEDALKEVIENYHNKQGEEFELACNIYPTAPFITAKRLKEAYEIILAGECNAVFPVVQFSFPPQRGLSEAGGYLQPTSPDNYMKRSQDLQPIYARQFDVAGNQVHTFCMVQNCRLKSSRQIVARFHCCFQNICKRMLHLVGILKPKTLSEAPLWIGID
jgi:CMP-N-acetylneuraminic acid synthetase